MATKKEPRSRKLERAMKQHKPQDTSHNFLGDEHTVKAQQRVNRMAGNDQSPPKWEDLAELRNGCVETMLTITALQEGLQEVMPFVADQQYLNTMLSTMVQDATAMHAELTAIGQMFAGRTGEVDADFIMDYFNIAEAFQTWMTRFEGGLQPTYNALTDIYYNAKVQKELAAGAEVEKIPAQVEQTPTVQ